MCDVVDWIEDLSVQTREVVVVQTQHAQVRQAWRKEGIYRAASSFVLQYGKQYVVNNNLTQIVLG